MRKNKERGAALIELAVSIVAVTFLMFWMFELGMLAYTNTVLSDAAKEGVRYAVVHGPGNSSASGPSSGSTSVCSKNQAKSWDSVYPVVTNYVAASGRDTSGMTVNVCYLDGSNQLLNRVQVTISYTFVPFFKLGWNPPTLNAASEGRILN